MKTKNTIELCKKLNSKNFIMALKSNPKAPMLVLANAYWVMQQKKSERSEIKQALAGLKAKLNAAHVNALWQALQETLENKKQLLPPNQQQSLIILRKNMVYDLAFARHIDKKDYILVAKDPIFYPMVFINLLRRALFLKKANDPITNKKISLQKLLQHFYQKNHEGVHHFLQQCKCFPAEDFELMAKTHPTLMERILADIHSTPWETLMLFEFSQLFPHKHKFFIRKYQAILDTAPVTPHQEKILKAGIVRLQKKHAAFSSLKLHKKIDLDPAFALPSSSWLPFSLDSLLEAGAGLMGLGLGLVKSRLTDAIVGPAIIHFSPVLNPIAPPLLIGGGVWGAACMINRSGITQKISARINQAWNDHANEGTARSKRKSKLAC